MAKRATAAANTEHLPPEMDYRAHEATYGSFIRVVKWSIALLVVTVIALYFIIRP